MASRVMLQSGGMRGRGLGWKAERCVDPGTCDLHLCVADDEGGYWHPEDPLAFAKWRVRADLDAIPTHVMVRVRRGWDALRRSLMVGAVGLGGTAAVVGMWWGGHRIFSMKTLSGSGAYAPKAPRSA
jgi:hypothetical protein